MSGSFSPRKLLLPLVPVYRLGLWLRVKTAPVKRLRLPVVSIGNLSTGGSGKTPLTIADVIPIDMAVKLLTKLIVATGAQPHAATKR